MVRRWSVSMVRRWSGAHAPTSNDNTMIIMMIMIMIMPRYIMIIMIIVMLIRIIMPRYRTCPDRWGEKTAGQLSLCFIGSRIFQLLRNDNRSNNNDSSNTNNDDNKTAGQLTLCFIGSRIFYVKLCISIAL